MTHTPTPRRDGLRALLAALAIVVVTILTLVVMLTLQLTSFATFTWSIWLTVVFGGIIAVLLTGLIGSSKRRGRARNISDHPASETTTINVFSPDGRGEL